MRQHKSYFLLACLLLLAACTTLTVDPLASTAVGVTTAYRQTEDALNADRISVDEATRLYGKLSTAEQALSVARGARATGYPANESAQVQLAISILTEVKARLEAKEKK